MPIKFLDKSSPPPMHDAVVNRVTGLLADAWLNWFGRVPATFGAIPSVLNTVSLTGQGASISATAFENAIIPAGIYKASYYARITTAAGVSSSLTLALGWTDGGVAITYTGAAITGNTTATYQQGSVILRSDAGSHVTYTTTYASNAAGVMKYSLDLYLQWIRPA